MRVRTASRNGVTKRSISTRVKRTAILIFIGVVFLISGFVASSAYSNRAARSFYDSRTRFNHAYRDQIIKHQKTQRKFNPNNKRNKKILRLEAEASYYSAQYDPPASRHEQTLANIFGCIGIAGLLAILAGLLLLIKAKRIEDRDSMDSNASSDTQGPIESPNITSRKQLVAHFKYLLVFLRTSIRPEKAFLLLGIVFGTLLLVINPPFRVSDGNIHYLKAYSVSEGHITSLVAHDAKAHGKVIGVGSKTTFGYLLSAQRINFVPLEKTMKGKEIIDALSIPPGTINNQRYFHDFGTSGMALYSPILYIPQALGILAGRAFHLSPLLLLYMGRFFNLLFFLVLVYITISIMPVLKWAMFLLALMPQTIFIAASVSADGPLLGYCFVTFAYFLYLALDVDKHSIGKKELLIILLLAVVLGLAKTPYFLLVLLFLMIPRDRLKDRRRYYQVFVLVLAVASIVCASWNLVVKDANRVPSPTVKPGAQLKGIIKNPLKLPQVIYSTSRNTQGPTSTRMPSAQQIVGTVSWIAFVLPVWFGFLYIYALIAVSALDKEVVRVGFRQKAVSLCTAALIWIGVLAIFYLFWSPLGSKTITGINSRYFIPIAPLALLMFYNQKIRYAKGPWFYALILSFSAISIFITIFWMLKNCYG